MAPGSNNQNNNNNRQTGTRPKIKASKKNSVPREVVAPTRRDLQQQLNVLVDWATVSGAAAAVVNNQQQGHTQSHSNPQQSLAGTVAGGVGAASNSSNHQQQNFLLKPRNNRTPGEGTCYEIDNLALQDNSRYIPVRPIVRRNLLSESSGAEQGESHNTAVGVVIPTTPSSGLQTFRLNDTGTSSGTSGAATSNINNLLNNTTGSQKHILNPFHPQSQQQQLPSSVSNLRASPLSSRVPDGASQNQLNLNKNSNQQQQQLHGGAVGGTVGAVNLSKANVEDKLHQIQEYIKLTTNLISSVQLDNLNGPRPQSVQSISTTHSATPVQTPSYDDLRFKMENQSKSMQALKEQQAHLLRLQQAARLQLQEMEAIRNQTAASIMPLESFESVEQVQDGISGIMERMRVLATFIQNQQELGNMLGGDNDDVLNEQVMLQQKFQELRDKKAQMHNLVSELQNLNVEASRQFEGGASKPIERNIPIELTNAPASASDMRQATKTFNHSNVDHGMMNGSRGGSITPKVENVTGVRESDLHEEDEAENTEAINGTAEMLNEKINEINAMKSQLRRLKEMMDTVKLIEMKNGESIDEEEDAPEENDENPDSVENSRSPSVVSQISDHGATAAGSADPRRDQLNQRVEALHAMTRDLREQAKSIAAERDAMKNAQSEINRRRNNVSELQRQAEAQTAEKLTNHVASFVSSIPPGPKERQQMALKAELEQKKRELERIANMTQSIKKNTDLSRHNTEVAPPKVSSVSSADSLRSQSHPPVIPPPPAASAVNNTAGSNVTNHSKNSADSGVTDIFANAHLESGSYQSSSTRSLNMVPPMPDICNRPERYRKSEDVGTSTARTDRTSPWPAHLFSGAGPSSSNTGPQSPHFHPFVGSDIHVSSAYPTYNTYPTYSNLLPPHTPNSAPPPPDPLMFQHFMQTQQMLMNSITQCNQLLWIQQREINNLNNAVLLLQERILNNASNNILMNDNSHVTGVGSHIRAESTPPNNSLNSATSLTGSVYGRARSEQPTMVQQQGPASPYHTIPSTIHQPSYGNLISSNQFPSYAPSSTQPQPPHHQQSNQQYSINQQIQRNNTNISNSNATAATANSSNSSHRSYRNLRHVNINTANNAIYEQQHQLHQQLYEHHGPLHPNNYVSQNGTGNDDSNLQPQQQYNNASAGGAGSLGPSNMINNLANGPTTTGANMAPQPCLNNLNNSSNLNSNSVASQQQQTTTQALNNQVLPGVRANNYWDNFRSYSRQNLLSSNSCKSNEDSCTFNSGSCTNNNINNQIQRNNSNVNNFNNSNNATTSSASGGTGGGSGTGTGNKYPPNFNRNNSFSNINQQSNAADLGPNQQQPSVSSHHQSSSQQYETISRSHQQQQPQPDGGAAQFQTIASQSPFLQHPQTTQQSQQHQHHQQQQQAQPHHHTPLSQSTSFDLGELQFHTNPINLGLANKSGHPKASGNKKYPLSLRSCRDGNNLGGESSSNFYGVGAHAEMVSDLNLATASNYQHDSKSTSKLFEALKENVYQEVKNLITANESRPHFLIQLFRELQLISSDPLRQRTLQSIQELYNRYIESTLQQEQQEGHVNNVGSNNLLSSNAVGGGQVSSVVDAENVEVVEVAQNFTNVRQQQQFQFAPSAESTPIAGGNGSGANTSLGGPTKDLEPNDLGGMASSEIISIIMGDIVGVINSVDYINDSVLCKIAGVICNHATGASNGLFQQLPAQQEPEQGLLDNPMLGPSMAAFLTQNETDVISREDFLRHLESWNRTDKDEFISNLENLLNNILLRSSAAEGDSAAVSSSNMNGDEEGQMRAQQMQQQHDSLSSFSNGNNNTTGDISTDNNETFQSYGHGGEHPFTPVTTNPGAVGGNTSRRVYGISESDKMPNGVSSSNGYALTTYDLAEADQICDMDKVLPAGDMAGGAVGGVPNSRNVEQMTLRNDDNRRWVLQMELERMAGMAEKAAQEQFQREHSQQHQQPQGRANDGRQEEESEGNLDPEEQLPIFY
ncbi:probable WRKY transcription factor protein 1 isoform X3 [Armigeres subalbatus]|uniref:probable WRKY transcription factor protein 1 isoform X3 n=1 Tax=Armigeres subalbatus TaxID=124917 RepID=UPI002ED00321